METNHFSSMEVNGLKALDFRQIVTAGWANLSDGNVEATTGHFAVVEIEDAELGELVDAVFDGADPSQPRAEYVGHWLLSEDSNGNATLYGYETLDLCMQDFNVLQAHFERWDRS